MSHAFCPRGPRALLGAAVIALALSLSGCSARGASLGTTSSPCFHALPAAAAAVGHEGRFLGVRLVAASRLTRRVPAARALGKDKVCLIGYQGAYQPGQVELPLQEVSGSYAVVAVNPAGSKVLGTLLLRHLPLAFRHNV